MFTLNLNIQKSLYEYCGRQKLNLNQNLRLTKGIHYLNIRFKVSLFCHRIFYKLT